MRCYRATGSVILQSHSEKSPKKAYISEFNNAINIPSFSTFMEDLDFCTKVNKGKNVAV